VWFWRRKEDNIPITLQIVYVSGMRLLFGHPFGISIDKIRGGKIMKREFKGRRSRGVYYIRSMPRGIRITYPAPKDLLLTVFYGLLFAKSYTESMVAYVEFRKDLIKPLKAKVRMREDPFIPGKRIYNMLTNRDGVEVLVHDEKIVDTLPRNKRGIPIPPNREMLFVHFNPQTSYGYVFYIANLKRVGKRV